MSISGELAIASHRSNQVRNVDSSFSSLKKAETGNTFKIIGLGNYIFLKLEGPTLTVTKNTALIFLFPDVQVKKPNTSFMFVYVLAHVSVSA